MYASGEQWKNWMKDYRFGTLVFVPNGDLRQTVDALRNEYDPLSASTTISESGRESDEVQAINSDLNSRYRPWSDSFSAVAWIIPDEEFVFKVHRLFDLK